MATTTTKTKAGKTTAKTSAKKHPAARRSPKHRAPGSRKPARRDGRYWSARVTHESDALDLEPAVFKHDSPLAIARSLKRSAARSKRRKSSPYRSAMSMLTFYVNRGGTNLGKRRLSVLERAKDELRKLFGRA
jgi:hypothetical protein